ncbi:MAG: hypothetical protein AAF368_19885, partial [Planctomycetota bacterium]
MRKRISLALLLLAQSASADVLLVDVGGGGDFQTIGSALAASTEADVLLVAPGSYPGVVITDRSATILGLRNSPGSTPEL